MLYSKRFSFYLLAGAWLGSVFPVAAAPHHEAHLPPVPVVPSQLPPTPLARNAAAGLAKTYGGTKIDVTTYHYDLNRTG